MRQQEREREKDKTRESFARLSAPQHIVTTRFEEHRRIEGYEQDRAVPDFYGCDRLWKLDTIYGRIQMGYHPGRRQSFLFANLKTSIFGTAASSDQRRFTERRQMREVKSGTQNVAFSARRRANSAVLLYKAENKPWSEESIRPYLRRANLEALGRTMPFLVRGERGELAKTRDERKKLERDVREALAARDEKKLAEARLAQRELSRRQDELASLFTRKQAQSRLFFRKINIAFDLQKAKMFEYYRAARVLRAQRAVQAAVTEETENGGTQRTDN